MPHLTNFRFSAQSLQDYVECQRRFSLRYIQKMDWPAEQSSPYLAFEQYRHKGELFHICADQYFHGIDPAMIKRQIRDDDLRAWWQNFLDFIQKQFFAQTVSEILFQTSLGKHVLVAKFDLLAVTASHEVIIFDWKTTAGDHKPARRILADKMQTLIYPYILCRAGLSIHGENVTTPAKVTLEYWFPQYPTEPEIFPYSSTQMQNDEEKLRGLMDEIDARAIDDFSLTEDEKRCRFCVYRSYCGRGKEAGNILNEDHDTTLNLDLGDLDLDFENIEEIAY